jgi:hypothetical protein
MTTWEFVSVMTSALGVSGLTAAWLVQKLVDHKLSTELESFKHAWQLDLERHKAVWAGEIRQDVDTALGDKAADREYHLEARKRLYKAVGPLRFQLLLACRDLSGRVIAHGTREAYSTDLDSYYGQSFLFRILRPLALAELAEREITYQDFSVDLSACEMLRFKKTAFAIFSGSQLVNGHSAVKWIGQSQHVFFDYLGKAANALIISEENRPARCMRFEEFVQNLIEDDHGAKLEPFPEIFKRFNPSQKPLFWLRLVGFANLCNHFINQQGASIGFEQREFPTRRLLEASKDPEILSPISIYEQRCADALKSPL